MFCLCSHQIIAVLLHRGQYTKMLNLFMPSGGIIHTNSTKKDTKSAMSTYLKEKSGKMIQKNIA